ncbi:MAG: hypothetical protein WCV69_02200 [Patescibacteria group bacterium]|jgi:hypothetical protein
MKKEYFNVNKPLQLMSLMIGLSEVGFSLIVINNNISEKFIWAMVLLPFIVIVLFFYVLIFRPNNLYGPSDFVDQKDFLSLQGRIQKIEEVPFIKALFKYSKLEEPAIRLFLAAYYMRKNDDNNTKWQALISQFGQENIERSKNKLVELNWLSNTEVPFATTKEGKEAHEAIKEFVYGRLS